MQFKITINEKWCKQCGLCVHFCSKQVLQMKPLGAPEVTSVENCIGCRQCEGICPDFAVSVEKCSEASV